MLIGTEFEVEEAKASIMEYILSMQNGKLEYSLNFILPKNEYHSMEYAKNEIFEIVSDDNSNIALDIKLFKPQPPRKYLTVNITGTWNQVLWAKKYLLEKAEYGMGEYNLSTFRQFVQV